MSENCSENLWKTFELPRKSSFERSCKIEETEEISLGDFFLTKGDLIAT
jgi:hypothetical protein